MINPTMLTTRSVDGVPELSKLPFGEIVFFPGSLLPLSESVGSRASLEGAVSNLRLDSTWFVHNLSYGLLRSHLILYQPQGQLVVPSLLLLGSKPVSINVDKVWQYYYGSVILSTHSQISVHVYNYYVYVNLITVNMTVPKMVHMLCSTSSAADLPLLVGRLFLLSQFLL